MVNEQRLTDTFLTLARINSPSRQESEAMAEAQARLERLGFTVERDKAGEAIGGNTGNIIARRKGATSAPPVFFNAHIDTVQPTPNIQIIHENGVIRTDGSTILGADDKAGVACLLEALESLAEDGAPTADTEIIITIAEEIGLLGARQLDPATVRARSGWVVDSGQPLNGIIVNAPSQDKIRATITGRAAHAGARPEEGISAIVVAARAIAAMPHGRIDEETTANVGVIHGGQATNIVAPSCEIVAEARSRNTDKLQRQTAAMVDALETAAREAGATVNIEVDRIFDTFRVDEDAREVNIARAAMRDVGLEPVLSGTGGGMDANHFNAKGMRCCVVGCGYQDIHTTDENIATADMATGARIVEALMRHAAQA